MKEKYKILIVSEQDELLETIKNLLETEKYEVETTYRATEALEKVKSNKYHIVLIETDISDMDGIELLKQIKSYDALTQIIMMTEHSTMDKILSSLEYGANDYIMNPLKRLEEVAKIIKYSIEKLERWRTSIIEIVS